MRNEERKVTSSTVNSLRDYYAEFNRNEIWQVSFQKKMHSLYEDVVKNIYW